MKWFLPYWKEQKGLLVLTFITTAISIAAQTALPLCLKFLIDTFNTADFSTQKAYFLVTGYLLLGIFTVFTQQFLPNLRSG